MLLFLPGYVLKIKRWIVIHDLSVWNCKKFIVLNWLGLIVVSLKFSLIIHCDLCFSGHLLQIWGHDTVTGHDWDMTAWFTYFWNFRAHREYILLIFCMDACKNIIIWCIERDEISDFSVTLDFTLVRARGLNTQHTLNQFSNGVKCGWSRHNVL